MAGRAELAENLNRVTVVRVATGQRSILELGSTTLGRTAFILSIYFSQLGLLGKEHTTQEAPWTAVHLRQAHERLISFLFVKRSSQFWRGKYIIPVSSLYNSRAWRKGVTYRQALTSPPPPQFNGSPTPWLKVKQVILL